MEEMNEGIIASWNECVTPHDQVYHLGDFAFAGLDKSTEILGRLNGTKFLVAGNHDRDKKRKGRFLDEFGWIKNLTRIKVKYYHEQEARFIEAKIVLCHFPLLSWEGMQHGSWHLHGHCHGSLDKSFRGKRMDVGIDTHPGCSPYSLLDVEEYMHSRSFVQVDHHG